MASDLRNLIEILKEGTGSLDKNGNGERCTLAVEGEYVVFARMWAYDDFDMNEDEGSSSARIKKDDMEKLLKEAAEKGRAEGVFGSVNSFHSRARYSEGCNEVIEGRDYPGKARIEISTGANGAACRFLPTPPKIPAVRLSQDRDYLAQ